ncbi:hypothetical protein GCM10027610_044660 [Dactylosporangium cerinum]
MEHGYQVPAGPHLVVVSGTRSVPREQLRAAAATLRPLTQAEVGSYGSPGRAMFTVDVQGYSTHGQDAPPGIALESTDPAATPRSVRIEVTVDRLDFPCAPATCPADADGLQYREIQDLHGYLIRRGTVNVSVLGGVGVDRAVLRRAALDARPVTDEELLRVLPPVPQRQGPLQRLRDWFG